MKNEKKGGGETGGGGGGALGGGGEGEEERVSEMGPVLTMVTDAQKACPTQHLW